MIGARVGAVPSVIDEGRDGLLVEYQDADSLARAIIELLTDRDLRERMGAAGRRKVLQDHTWDSVSDRVRDVYVKVTSRRLTERKGEA